MSPTPPRYLQDEPGIQSRAAVRAARYFLASKHREGCSDETANCTHGIGEGKNSRLGNLGRLRGSVCAGGDLHQLSGPCLGFVLASGDQDRHPDVVSRIGLQRRQFVFMLSTGACDTTSC